MTTGRRKRLKFFKNWKVCSIRVITQSLIFYGQYPYITAVLSIRYNIVALAVVLIVDSCHMHVVGTVVYVLDTTSHLRQHS